MEDAYIIRDWTTWACQGVSIFSGITEVLVLHRAEITTFPSFSDIWGQKESQLWEGKYGAGKTPPGPAGAAAERGWKEGSEGTGRAGAKREGAPGAGTEEAAGNGKAAGETTRAGETKGRRKEERNRKAGGCFLHIALSCSKECVCAYSIQGLSAAFGSVSWPGWCQVVLEREYHML